ncbi:MAG: alpha/beta fold hydrolase, partial [Mycolicibacterium sp.]
MFTVDVPAGPIAYDDTGGDGPVLVFGHGLLMDGRQWRKVLPLLPGYRCITPTLPLGAHTVPMRDDADLTQTGVAGILADFLDAL